MRRWFVQSDIGDLGGSYLSIILVEDIYGHWAESATEFDYAGFGDGVGEAGCEEPYVHIRGGEWFVRACLGHDRKASGAISQGHEQPAVDRFVDAVETFLSRHDQFAVALFPLVERKTQRGNDRYRQNSIQNRLYQIGFHLWFTD